MLPVKVEKEVYGQGSDDTDEKSMENTRTRPASRRANGKARTRAA